MSKARLIREAWTRMRGGVPDGWQADNFISRAIAWLAERGASVQIGIAKSEIDDSAYWSVHIPEGGDALCVAGDTLQEAMALAVINVAWPSEVPA